MQVVDEGRVPRAVVRPLVRVREVDLQNCHVVAGEDAEERQALYAQLFGTNFGPTLATPKARNTEFESLMIDLAEALYKLEDIAHAGLEVPVQAAANQLADNLVTHGSGMALVASRDLLSAIEACVAILKRPQVQQRARNASIEEQFE